MASGRGRLVFESLAPRWHQHGRLCSLSKWHQPGLNHSSACVKPPSWHAEAHIDHITCPPHTDNKVQDVSSCRTAQEMSSNWRLRERTRRTRLLKTKSLHAYNHKLSFFRGADSRLSNQFVDVFLFSHVFSTFSICRQKGCVCNKGIWTHSVPKCAEQNNLRQKYSSDPELLQPVIKNTVVMFVHYYKLLHPCDD